MKWGDSSFFFLMLVRIPSNSLWKKPCCCKCNMKSRRWFPSIKLWAKSPIHWKQMSWIWLWIIRIQRGYVCATRSSVLTSILDTPWLVHLSFQPTQPDIAGQNRPDATSSVSQFCGRRHWQQRTVLICHLPSNGPHPLKFIGDDYGWSCKCASINL